MYVLIVPTALDGSKYYYQILKSKSLLLFTIYYLATEEYIILNIVTQDAGDMKY